MPAIFFLVAMFLLQNVLTRLIDTQRSQIGLMKAFGYRSRRVSLSGIAQKADLHRLIDDEGRPLHMPPDGLVVSARLAAVLGIRPGDPITIEVLEGERQTRQVTLMRLSGDLVGVAAYMDQHALAKLLGEGGNWSGARLSVDQHAAAHLYATLKRLPAVNAVAVRQSVIASFRKIMDESVRLSTSINFAFACV